MFNETPARGDLVGAMTIAEIFLLLVFAIWCGAVAINKGPMSSSYWRTIAEQYRKDNDKLKSSVAELIKERDKLQKAVDFWQENFGISPPASITELTKALQSPRGKIVLQDAARGYPRCDGNNVLVHATVRDGAVTVRVAEDSTKLKAWLKQNRVAPIGTVLEGWPAVDAFSATISQFYGGTQNPCRFDYSLNYKTPEDYYNGRERLERIFYPAGITRTSPH